MLQPEIHFCQLDKPSPNLASLQLLRWAAIFVFSFDLLLWNSVKVTIDKLLN